MNQPIPVKYGDIFELEYEREDGSIATATMPYINLDGHSVLLRDHAPYMEISPEELYEDLILGQLRGNPGILRRSRVLL